MCVPILVQPGYNETVNSSVQLVLEDHCNLVSFMSAGPVTESAVVPTNGMVIRSNTQLRPGVYYLPDGVVIDADGVTLEGNGAIILGHDRRGVGITVDGHRDVTIRNVRAREYYHGIAARGCRGLTLEQNQITSTAEVETNTVFLNIWTPIEDAYGAAILLDRVSDARVHDNDLQHQMNGLLSYNCTRLDVRRNSACYNSGFGFHLFQTCDSVFEQNWADYCNRYEPRDEDGPIVGVGHYGHMGADATGFLLVQKSCNNVFRHNFARCGGDGFFLAGRNPEGEDVGCDGNLFEGNDASLSPNIAFEATFSRGNIFRNNWADRGNFGFWLGYSSENIVEGNRMLYNRQAGIAVEHGANFEVRDNDFQSNGTGLLIWSRFVDAFQAWPGTNRTSHDWLIENNRFLRNECGIAIRADRDHGIRPDGSDDCGKPELRPRDHTIRGNDIQDNRVGIHLLCADRTVIEQNKINKNVEADVRREDDVDTKLGHNLGMRGAYL